ncbi:hypothetical protein GCK72_015938 [Caenorhabditis remanei]|uniref:Uncharacterized protein n=1 Tax=Caenorhabditis remanei TaxID=31234 RepID=A0A6A5GXR9_CAERE|nr:hypothetical protein GCK72_015938 [Caenorhabditis remanei]KAF1759471.1 hypothetical protein GCK72_015938 [Caenorhabditis remanei]
MKYTVLFLISISLLSNVNCICETNCSCPDLRAFAWNEDNIMTYEEGIGCTRKIMCYKQYYDDGIRLVFNATEIPFPSDKDPNNDWLQAPTQDEMWGMDVALIDFFSYFGFVCENGVWYITKYPHGIVYANAGSGFTGPTDEFNGKRSKVKSFYCHDWREYVESTPMP